MKTKIALLLGASGSVGSDLLQALLNQSAYEKVVIFVRKALPADSVTTSTKLIQKIVSDMSPAGLSASVKETMSELASQYPQLDLMGFSALGIGAKTAQLTIDQHRAVDVDLNQAFAAALKGSPQVKSMNLLSAIGSNPKAKATGSGAAGMPRYARVKGEAEEAVKLHGPKVVNIFQPAMIVGSQHTPKSLAVLAPVFDLLIPKKYHSITTKQIALSMVAASLSQQESSKVYTYPEMVEII